LKFVVLISISVILFTGCGADPNRDPNELVIHSVLPAKIGTLDPGNWESIYEHIVLAQIFEPLYEYHYLKRPYEVVPLLADGAPQVSDDILTYIIKIKKGIYFHDDPCFQEGYGRELKASDFIYSLKRIANIKYLSKNWWLFEDKIVGLDEFREYTKTCESEEDVDYLRLIEGLQAPDDYTLVIKLKRPWPQLIYVLTYQAVAVAKEAVDYYGEDIINCPVGTGPFMLKTWHRGSYIDLVRNPNFRKDYYPTQGQQQDAEQGLLDDAGKTMPFVDRIIFRIIEEDQPRWFLFLRGQIDNIIIPKDNFGQAIAASMDLTPAMTKRNIRLNTYRQPSTLYIGFNLEDKILGANKPLREAISLALDRAKYIELFWNNRDEIAHGLIPPVMKSYNPDIKKTGQRYDPEKAEQLIRQAQKIYGGKLPTLKLSMAGTDIMARQIGQFWQRCLKDVGLDVEVEHFDLATFLNKIHTKNAQMFYCLWTADYPDAESFLQLFYSKNISPGVNSFNYHSLEFDKLYEKASCMPDCPERTLIYRQAEKIVIQDCPAAFINHPLAYMLHHDWLGNYKPHAFQFGLVKYYKIDKRKRDAYKELVKGTPFRKKTAKWDPKKIK
jgi:oligopeptide transport system substrate-binding protein